MTTEDTYWKREKWPNNMAFSDIGIEIDQQYKALYADGMTAKLVVCDKETYDEYVQGLIETFKQKDKSDVVKVCNTKFVELVFPSGKCMLYSVPSKYRFIRVIGGF
jgi:hypothetical protein